MAGAGVVTTTITTPDPTRVLSVFAGGADVTGDVTWSSFVVTDSGASAKGTLNLTIERDPSLLTGVTDQGLVRVVDHSANGGEVFRGFIRARIPNKDPQHPSLSIIADDLTSLLDDTVIAVEWRPPETLQSRLGYLWGLYAGNALSADFQYVQSVGGTLPAQRFALVSLRNAIEMTLAQASGSSDYYIDMLGKLHVFTSETNNAPKDVNADAPGGTEIAPEHLQIEYDSNSYANRVYVSGANPDASLYVQDDAAIAAANGIVRTTQLQEPSVTTAAMAIALGQMYLGRVKVAKPRGSFETSSNKVDGWRAGQNVLVTSASHSLSAQSYKIARVTTKVLVGGPNLKRHYTVEFGGASAGAGIDGQQPIIAGQMSGVYMLDQLGNAIISNAASAALGSLGPSVRRYIRTGVYNGDFYAPPPGPDAPIDNSTNPMPYWSFTQASGTAVSAISQLDTAQGSGRSLVFSMVPGSAGDEGYIEQIIPVTGSRGRNYAYRCGMGFVTGSTVDLSEFYVSAQYLKGDGVTTTGTVDTSSIALNSVGASTLRETAVTPNGPFGITSDAYYIRLRIGYKRAGLAAGTAGGGATLTDVTASSGVGYFADVTDAGAYGNAAMSQGSGIWEFIANQGGAGSDAFLRLDGSTAAPAVDFAYYHNQKMKWAPQGALARRTTTQSINTATWTGISMNASEDFDPFGFHDTATNPSRFTVPTGWSGTYLLVGHCDFAASGAGAGRLIQFAKNGTATAGNDNFYPPSAAITHRMEVTEIKELSAGDYVELMVYQDSGGALNANPALNASASIMYLGELF